MTLARFIFAALVSLALGGAIASFGGPARGEDAQPQAEGGMRGFMHQLSEGQRLMFFQEMQKETEGLSDDQRHAVRKQERDKLLAMSDSDRQHFAADLQAKWDALSPADQAEIRQKVAAFRAERVKQWQNPGKTE